MNTPVITGLGVISSLGTTIQENYSKLHEGLSGIGPSIHLDSRYRQYPFGEVGWSNDKIYSAISNLNLPNERLSRTDLLAFYAFQKSIEDAGLKPQQCTDPQTGFISASTVGGMCLTDELYRDANKITQTKPYVNSYGPSAHTRMIYKAYNLMGFSTTIATACSSSANAILLGARLIQQGVLKRAIVGGVDSLAKFTVNGFNALQILSENPCAPFDNDRDGLNLGEAAAYLVLEEKTMANKKPYAQLVGWGNTNDAFHPSALNEDGSGVLHCMNLALKKADIAPSAIDLINTHGTATPNNDYVENLAMQNLFPHRPDYFSTKSYTGHTLGAAGALEAIFSILSLTHGEGFASLRCKNPLSEQYPPLSKSKKIAVNTIMSNSFGFAGNCTSLIFSGAENNTIKD